MKIILNKQSDGIFSVSDKGYRLYCEKIGKTAYLYNEYKYDMGYLYRIDNDTDKDNRHYVCCVKDYGKYFVKESELKEKDILYLSADEYRENPILVEVVEELGKEASDKYSDLRVINIPDNVDYTIDTQNGVETLYVIGQSYWTEGV